MNTIVFLSAVSAVCSLASPVYRDDPKPEFCNDLDCPRYTLMHKTSEYELRCYKSYNWASTVVTGYTYKEGTGKGFMRLFEYIQGQNIKSEKINMTAPVLIEVQPAQGPFCKNNFTVNFFVPDKMQANPIPPTSKDVYISKFKKLCAYVRVYDGFPTQDEMLKNAAALGEALLKDKLQDTYHNEYYFNAGYDSPFKIFNRHNEVWFVKK